jgi:hypothetical protein
VTLDLQARAELYKAAFPDNPASWPWLSSEQGRRVLYAIWVVGANYGNESEYYGAHPRGYLKRVMAMYPDAGKTLHVFSGSLPSSPDYVTVDCRADVGADLVGSVYDIERLVGGPGHLFNLLTADPPYSDSDAERYGSPMIDRRRVTEALADVAAPGAHLVWLDTCWPMHSKAHWVTVGRIMLQRSTNHRVRAVTILERV